MGTTLQNRVAEGAAFLDQKHPGWQDEIDLETLDLCWPEYCILGQLYRPSANDWRSGWRLGVETLGLNDELQVGYGLEVAVNEDHYGYRELTVAWVEEILNRR